MLLKDFGLSVSDKTITGDQLRNARYQIGKMLGKKKLNQDEMGTLLGYSPNHISKMEATGNIPQAVCLLLQYVLKDLEKTP